MLCISCTATNNKVKLYTFSDLNIIRQELIPLSYKVDGKKIIVSKLAQREARNLQVKQWFSPWNEPSKGNQFIASKNNFDAFIALPCVYNERLIPWRKEQLDAIQKNINAEAYPSCEKKAILLATCSLRSAPTSSPLYIPQEDAKVQWGTGYPFDMLQETTLPIGTPLLVRHYSKDKKWVYVEHWMGSGWVETHHTAIINDIFQNLWQAYHPAYITQDETLLANDSGEPVVKVNIGTMLPLTGIHKDSVELYIPIRDTYGDVCLAQAYAPMSSVAIEPLPLTAENIAVTATPFIDQSYGWGGAFGYRDCSSMVHDLFTPFGIWVPRNSNEQSELWRKVSLKDLTDEEKKARIIKDGIPFATLLYRPGHIMLYVGESQGEPLVLHNIWSQKIKLPFGKSDDRIIIGRTIISTTTLGKERADIPPNFLLIHNINSMNILDIPNPPEPEPQNQEQKKQQKKSSKKK